MQKMRLLALVGIALAVAFLAPLAAGCGGGDGNGDAAPTATRWADVTPVTTESPGDTTPESVTVEALHGEWYLNLSQETAPAGPIVFNAVNEGTILHNFKVTRTDLDPGALPVDSSVFKVDEAQLDILASSSDMPPGAVEQLILDLPPGKYVLFCNIEGHYEAGVYSGFTVE